MANTRKLLGEMKKEGDKDLGLGIKEPFQFGRPNNLSAQAKQKIDKRNPDKQFIFSDADTRRDLFPENPLESEGESVLGPYFPGGSL